MPQPACHQGAAAAHCFGLAEQQAMASYGSQASKQSMQAARRHNHALAHQLARTTCSNMLPGPGSSSSRSLGNQPIRAGQSLAWIEVAVAVAQQDGAHGLASREGAAPELEQAGLGLGGCFGRDGQEGEPGKEMGESVQCAMGGSSKICRRGHACNRGRTRATGGMMRCVRHTSTSVPSMPATCAIMQTQPPPAHLRSAARSAMACTASPRSTCLLLRSLLPRRSTKNSCGRVVGLLAGCACDMRGYCGVAGIA